MDCRFPKITQDGRDGDEETGYIANLRDGAHAGFKYFDCEGTLIAKMPNGGMCFDQQYFPYKEDYPENYNDCLLYTSRCV